MKYTLKRSIDIPLLISKYNNVVDVNNEFVNFSGYSKDELIGKSLREISRMIHIDSQVYLESIEDEYSCYMFTKEYEPREVTIYCKSLSYENEKTYFLKVKPNSSIGGKLPYVASLLLGNEIGIAIYSITHGILLEVNKRFLDFWDLTCKDKENRIGRTLEEIFTGYNGSNFEKVFLNVIKTYKPYYSKEVKYKNLEKGDTYWDISLVPIDISGKAKYIILTASDITEKVINRKLVEEQKEELKVIIENMSDGVNVVDKDYNCSLLNNGAREFIYKADSIKRVGDSFGYTKYYDFEGNLLTIENFFPFRVLKGERLKEHRVTAHRPDGIYHFNISGSPVYDKEGNITKAIICSRDVTEHVNKSELIRIQNEKLEAIIENMSDFLVIFDKYGKIKRFNKAAKSYARHSSSVEKMNYHFKKAEIFEMEGNQVSEEDSAFTKILRGEKLSQYQFAIKTKNDVIYTESSGNPIYDEKGNFIAGVLLTHDITDRVKSEENLLIKTQLDLLNNIIENLQIGVARCSFPGFKIIDFNHKCYEDLQQINPKVGSSSSLKGQNYFDIFNDDEKVEVTKVLQNLIVNKRESHFNYIKYIVSGEEKYLKVIYQPLFGLNKQIIELMVISIDINEEVKAQNKMKELLKMQEELLANVAHELKTPLNVIFSCNQLIEFYSKNNLLEANKEKVSKGINIIKQNCYRFTKLINNIVDLSKIESGFFKLNLSNENIVQVTEDIVQSVSYYINRKRLNIVFDTNIEEKIIACDTEKVERIILNLISNAIKFSNPEGSIFVNILDKGDTVEIVVKDTGIGIEKKYLDTIFKRFQQVDKSLSRNAEGSGIGLPLVKSIVGLHGGKISVESEVGQGSTFKVELPARTVENSKVTEPTKLRKDKIEMINIEFSDIYHI